MKLYRKPIKMFNFLILLIIFLNAEPNTAQQRYCGPILRDVLDVLCVNGFNPMPLRKRSDHSLHLIDNNGLREIESFNNRAEASNRFSDNDIDKSLNDDNDDNDDTLSQSFGNNNELWQKIFNSDVVNYLTKTRRRRHGVYEECCRKPCHVDELLAYCL